MRPGRTDRRLIRQGVPILRSQLDRRPVDWRAAEVGL